MSESKRLFFAIELPTTLQRRIVRWRASHFPAEAGRPVVAANMHLTLAFLGEVSAEKQRALSAMAGRISQPGLRCILTMPGNGCALGWSGWGRGSPSRTATARQHAAGAGRAAAVIRARSRFIPTLPCCAMRVRPLPSRHRAFTGPFR